MLQPSKIAEVYKTIKTRNAFAFVKTLGKMLFLKSGSTLIPLY